MEIVNVEQANAWDGHEGDSWTEHAERYEGSGVAQRAQLLAAAAIGPEDRVLDVGCGTGRTTIEAATAANQGEAVGLDLSTRMLAHATERAAVEGISNARFVRGDAQVHRFEPGSFDVAVSSFGVMFFNDPGAAWANIAGAIRPGGRLALLTWRSLSENQWLMGIREALALGRDLPMPPPEAPTPFSLADPERVRRLLGAAGFGDVELRPVDGPIHVGRDAEDAYAFTTTMGIVEGLLDGLDEASRAQGLANLRRLLKEHETDVGVDLPSAAWIITATR